MEHERVRLSIEGAQGDVAGRLRRTVGLPSERRPQPRVRSQRQTRAGVRSVPA
jgi:hypothetical protein